MSAAQQLAADLREMDSVGAISLAAWPAASEWLTELADGEPQGHCCDPNVPCPNGVEDGTQ